MIFGLREVGPQQQQLMSGNHPHASEVQSHGGSRLSGRASPVECRYDTGKAAAGGYLFCRMRGLGFP